MRTTPIGRLLLFVAVVLLIGPRVASARADCPDADYHFREGGGEFEGIVEGERIRIYFEGDPGLDPGDVALAGLIRRTARTTEAPNGLSGRLGRDCWITLDETGDGGVDATWRLRYASTARLVGHRRIAGGRRLAVRLDLVDGASCEGKEPWRTFRSPAWPLTFEYPGSWLVLDYSSSRPQAVTFACPNLFSRAYRHSVDLFHLTGGYGTGTMEMKDGRLVRRVADFFTEDGRRWLYGHSCEGEDGRSDYCPEARLSTLNGVTVLQVHSGTARNGLHVYSFLFLAPTGWVTFDTLDLQERVEGPGELEFHGSDARVLEQFVRSVRPSP